MDAFSLDRRVTLNIDKRMEVQGVTGELVFAEFFHLNARDPGLSEPGADLDFPTPNGLAHSLILGAIDAFGFADKAQVNDLFDGDLELVPSRPKESLWKAGPATSVSGGSNASHKPAEKQTLNDLMRG